MAHIRKDTQAALRSEIEEAHGIIDQHDAQMAAAKSDYNRLGEKYNDEVLYWQHVEDKLACAEEKATRLQGQVHARIYIGRCALKGVHIRFFATTTSSQPLFAHRHDFVWMINLPLVLSTACWAVV